MTQQANSFDIFYSSGAKRSGRWVMSLFMWAFIAQSFTWAGCQSADQNLTTMSEVKEVKEVSYSGKKDTATLGGGCFWCVEAIYQELKGVISVASGYSGGIEKNPTYKEVSAGITGHAEVIQVVFDPEIVTYEEILEVFFTTHDPTTLNRQGNDTGPQYRSVIFYHNEEQKAIAQKSKTGFAAEAWEDPVVTEISAFTEFYIAEDYHQNYYRDNKNQPYCVYVINPKLQKFKKKFATKLN